MTTLRFRTIDELEVWLREKHVRVSGLYREADTGELVLTYTEG